MITRCPLCPGNHNCIQPEGRETVGGYAFIADVPGREEDRRNKPLQGKAGQEVQATYLPLAGMRRSDVWLGTAISCLPSNLKGKLDPNKAQDIELLQSCAECNLYPALARMRPRLIIPMGAAACRVIDPSINLDFQHGIPIKTKLGMVFPMYSPLLGVFEPKKMLHIRTDWIRLRRHTQGRLRVAVDEYEGFEDYRALETADEIHEILSGYWDKPLACDTENKKDKSPFCLTFSVEPGTGYLIRAEQRELLDAFQEHLDVWTGRILWHNWLHDYEIVTAMGLRFPHRLIVDTMLLAFHLGNVPQGLKALSYRELGMKMSDFDDLVRPYSTQLVLRYFRDAYCEEWPKPEPTLTKGKDGKWNVKTPHGFSQKLKRFFTDFEKNGEKDVFEMWHNNWGDSHQMVEEKCGPFPGLCISHVPFDQVISYATRDADALLRLWPVIQHMRSQVRKTVQENWRAA